MRYPIPLSPFGCGLLRVRLVLSCNKVTHLVVVRSSKEPREAMLDSVVTEAMLESTEFAAAPRKGSADVGRPKRQQHVPKKKAGMDMDRYV